MKMAQSGWQREYWSLRRDHGYTHEAARDEADDKFKHKRSKRKGVKGK